jgi:lysozyme
MTELRLGDRGDSVRTLQSALVRAGHNPGPVDGVFGSRTDEAVRAFQRDRALKVDGVVGPLTWAALGMGTGPATVPTGLSARGVEFIARFEGFRSELYDDPAGHCTIGFGHLVHRDRCNGGEPAALRAGITRQAALRLLRSDAAGAATAVRQSVTVGLAQHEFDALASFTFNLGAGRFRKSTLLERLNAGRKRDVPAQLELWTKANGKVLPGLVARRKAEARLFTTGNYT